MHVECAQLIALSVASSVLKFVAWSM